MKRSAGVLLPISSLPGPFALGVFGKEAREFGKTLRKAGFSYWQILPLSPLDSFGSPYAADSAFAGNLLFIDPRGLETLGLAEKKEVEKIQYKGSPYSADYEFAHKNHLTLLRKAFERWKGKNPSAVVEGHAKLSKPEAISEIDLGLKAELEQGFKLGSGSKAGLESESTIKLKEKMEGFLKENEFWLPSYALFQASALEQGSKDWWTWKGASSEKADFNAVESERFEALRKEMEFQMFCQFIFFRQWKELKADLNATGIKIIGDIPFYVNGSGADVFSHKELFQLDKKGFPKAVAGVPPDYFTPKGQLWGNPLYDWKAMAKEGYSWWLERVSHNARLYDGLRLDHFAGFARVWAVPRGAEDATGGSWQKSPGMALVKKLVEVVNQGLASSKTDLSGDDRINAVGKENIENRFKSEPYLLIAEDLGVYSPEVIELLKDSGLPGMRVMEFAFGSDAANTHLPHNYPENCLAYTGTHDNNTLLGWIFELNEEERQKALFYSGFFRGVPGSGGPNGQGSAGEFQEDWGQGGSKAPACRSLIRSLWQSQSRLTVLPFQDLAGYGADTRMNTPGTTEENWTFRTTEGAIEAVDWAWLEALNRNFGRENRG